MGKKVFISHASEDKEVVSKFVDLVLAAGAGVSMDDIFYTSRDDTGVINGEDIPVSIKEGIMKSSLFIMMVSDNYRRSEVCLNEMGAAWAIEGLRKCILLLPNVGFDRIGWLMSLKKGTKLTDEDGLDSIYDLITEWLGVHTKTGTWNRNKKEFLKWIQGVPVELTEEETKEDGDEMDFLTLRERIDHHTNAYTQILKDMAGITTDYGEKITAGSRQLHRLSDNPRGASPTQIRSIFTTLARETDTVSETYERQAPLLRKHFDSFIKYGILLQQRGSDGEILEENRSEMQSLFDAMKDARKELLSFRQSLDDGVDLDKTFTKSKNRLKKAVDNLLSVISFCMGRASEYNYA